MGAAEGSDKPIHLDRYIQSRLYPQLSLKAIKRGLEQNRCRVNGQVERFHSREISPSDQVEFTPIEEKPLNILFEDSYLMVVDKPPFVVCDEKKGLLGYTLVHRLDKETSGALILAKTKAAETALLELFKERKVKKGYVALAVSKNKVGNGVIRDPIQGQSAVTAWRIVKKGKNYVWVECRPETGRTHQIRIHLAKHGMPIAGDEVYGAKSQVENRVMLHAESLEFIHPITRKEVKVQAPIPQEFYEAFNR